MERTAWSSADCTAWGWVDLVVGVVVVLAGVAVLTGARWAQVAGICLAGLRAALNIVFLAGYPFWAFVIITLEVLIIDAVAVDGRELKPCDRLEGAKPCSIHCWTRS